MPWAHGVAMGSRFTRRRFLTALGAGAAYLALTNTVGCELLERTSKLTSLRLPKVGPLRTPKVWPLPSVSSPPEEGAWAFLSPRPESGRCRGDNNASARRHRPRLHLRRLEGRSRRARSNDNRRPRAARVVQYLQVRERVQDAVLQRQTCVHLVGGQGHSRARRRRVCDLRCLLPRDRPGARGQRLPWGPPRVPDHS